MRLGQWVSLLALILSIYILWQIRQVLLLVFAAVVLATVLNRVVAILQRSRIPRSVAIAFTLILLFLILFGFFAVIVPRLADQFEQLGDLLPQALNQLRAGYDWLQRRIPGAVLDNDQTVGTLLQNLQTWITRLMGNFFFLVSTSVTVVLSVLLFLALTIMLLLNPGQYRQVFILAFPAFYRKRVDGILTQCETAIVGWIRGTLIAMGVIAFLSYVGLMVLRVPLPLVNALLAGLLEFVPNIGPTLSVVPPTLLALLDAPWKAGAVVILYLLIQQIESLVLVPMVMEHEVSLLPLFTVLSVVVFSLFFGFLGLFLAIPLFIVLQIWVKEVLVKDILNPWQKKDPQPESATDQI